MTTLDIGCGFIPERDTKRGQIGLDIRKGKCDVQGDALYLPFRDNIFSKIYMRSCLEHFSNPFQALNEAKRVGKPHCRFEIIIPVDARLMRWDLREIVTGFPFSIVEAYRKYWIRHKYKPIGHKNMIQPCHIQRFLRILKCELRGSHQWLHGRKGKFIRKLGHLPKSFGGRDYHILAKMYPNNELR